MDPKDLGLCRRVRHIYSICLLFIALHPPAPPLPNKILSGLQQLAIFLSMHLLMFDIFIQFKQGIVSW